MWGSKKPNTSQAVSPEMESLLTNKQSAEMMRERDTMPERVKACLGAGLHVKGEIIGTEDLVIDGSVDGVVELGERKLTVGATAKLTADINARDVVVYGYVKGKVRATGRIEIKEEGNVVGDLTTAQIMIEDGADFKGSIEIDRSKAKEAEKKVLTRAASAGAGRV